MPVIRFTRTGSSAVFGNFGPGDRLRCSDADARHFVHEALAAEYEDAPAEVAGDAPAVASASAAETKPARRARAAQSREVAP